MYGSLEDDMPSMYRSDCVSLWIIYSQFDMLHIYRGENISVWFCKMKTRVGFLHVIFNY